MARVVLGDERLVLGVVDGRRVRADGDDAQPGLPDGRHEGVVDEHVVARQRQFLADPVFLVLLHEADGVGAREPRPDGVSLRGACLGEVGREVRRVQRRVDLLHDFAASSLIAGDERFGRVPAGHEVRGHHDQLPVLRVLHEPRAHRVIRLVAGFGQAEDGRRRLLGRREHAREGDGHDQRGLLLVDVVADGQRHDAADGPDEKVDATALDELLDLRQPHVGLGLVVLLQHLDRAPTCPAVDLVEVQFEAVGGVDPLQREDAGVGQQQTDLDCRGLGRRVEGQERGDQERARQDGQPSSHRHSPG